MVSSGTTRDTSFTFDIRRSSNTWSTAWAISASCASKRDSRIWYADRFIDFPFQKNIHQLPEAEYDQCLRDLHERPEEKGGNFKEMLYARYGRGIAEKIS